VTVAAVGWPTTEGPLKTLATLGLVPHPEAPISWLRDPVAHQTPDGPAWKFRPLFLNPDAICALAALALEGYNVHVLPARQFLQVTIRSN
jgi:hypothetical protein